MNTKDLLFYNKEGYQMNLSYDEEKGIWSGKSFFDKNSTDTFKTQAVYLFEKVLGTNNNFQAYLDKFQFFNTDGMRIYPSYNSKSLAITDIRMTVAHNDFPTKWIYATGIEDEFYAGQYVYFTGLDGFYMSEFDTVDGPGRQKLFQIIRIEKGRAMIATSSNGFFSFGTVPTFNGTQMINPADVIEVTTRTNTPNWNQTGVLTKLYKNKKISLVSDSSENTGVYTVENAGRDMMRREFRYNPTLTLSANDRLEAKVTMYTDRIAVSNGVTEFGPASNPNGIVLPYVPNFLKAGDVIVAQAKDVSLNAANTVDFTVVSIDRSTNMVTVSSTPTYQSVDCHMYLTTNEVRFTQEAVMDSNNDYSMPITYWHLCNRTFEQLYNLGINVEYVNAEDSIYFRSNFTGTQYYNVEIRHVANNGTQTVIPKTEIIYSTIPVFVKEGLNEIEEFEPDSTLYSREIIFDNIDNHGLNVRINGIDYNVDKDVDVENTIDDWIDVHATKLAEIGIVAAKTGLDTIHIRSEFPNVPVFMQMNMGDFSSYFIPYKVIEFNTIKTQLLISINERNYVVPFDTDVMTTIANWVNTHKAILNTHGIMVKDNLNSSITFGVRDPERVLNITYNVGFMPRSGDYSVFENLRATPGKGTLLAGNEIKIVPGTYNFLNFYATGQKISIQGAAKTLQNISYNVIGLSNDTVSLSYQGPFWQQGLPVFTLNIVSDYFVRNPKHGVSGLHNPARLSWSFKDTKVNDFFLYDFSGKQLKPGPGMPGYTGPLPLCGSDGSIALTLNSKPNTKEEYAADPTKQQTIFEMLEHEMPYIDSDENINTEPEPIQVFVGYNSKLEGYNRTRLYLSLEEDIEYGAITSSNMSDNLWIFKDDYVEIANPTANVDFRNLGFSPGQKIRVYARDVNSDGRNIAVMENGGRLLVVKEVFLNRIVFTTGVVEENSIKTIPKTTLPFYDEMDNPLYENRTMEVVLRVEPRVIAYFDMYGETEGEDERHRINLDNRNKNILKLQDFYIFKEVDINEEGVDWIFMNRKRKQMLEIYPQIFNYVGSYKSIIEAINFFGYNDLTFTEYTQNVNPESPDFGKLFNMELLNIFDKSMKGWQFSNLAFENLRNMGFRKTNLFSLNYKITDNQGNFVEGYSFAEVKVKLNGLKKWLTENLLPIGTKIADINGKYVMPHDFILQHQTVMTRNFRVEEYSTPVDFDVSGYMQPINTGSDNYDVSVQFKSAGDIEWFDYRIKTFSLPQWNPNNTYSVNSKVYHSGYVWTALNTIPASLEPGKSILWEKTSLDRLEQIQLHTGYKWDGSGVGFTVSELMDPHFIVEVHWHSGYGCTMTRKKAYSVIPGFFDNLME
jgi:hypothetical protein